MVILSFFMIQEQIAKPTPRIIANIKSALLLFTNIEYQLVYFDFSPGY